MDKQKSGLLKIPKGRGVNTKRNLVQQPTARK